jgi:cell division septation protein DedD
MRGLFDDEEPEPDQPQRDTELTLGSTTLLAIFFGLVLICGLCFGLGYSVGRHGSQEPPAAMQPAAGAQTALQADSSRPKPSATAPTGVPPAPQRTVVNLPSSAAPSTNPAASGSSLGQSQVRSALPTVANPAQPAQSAAAPRVAPALAPAVPLMVQIAAVSHEEDAAVLVSALRKRGYAVVARREAADGLIHVRIGPFSSRDEANRWRMKLLNDGYNAVMQP